MRGPTNQPRTRGSPASMSGEPAPHKECAHADGRRVGAELVGGLGRARDRRAEGEPAGDLEELGADDVDPSVAGHCTVSPEAGWRVRSCGIRRRKEWSSIALRAIQPVLCGPSWDAAVGYLSTLDCAEL